MDPKLYRTVPSFQPQQQNLPQRPRDFSNSSPAPMSAFPSFSYDNSNDFSPWQLPVNGNNMMNVNNGPPFSRHMASPPPLLQFHHNGFGPAPPPPPPPPQHFSSAGPVGGFQQPPFANGMISPIHSPGLGPVNPHIHNNGNIFAPPPPPPPPPPSYHNIPPPPGSLGTRNQNQMPPPPNFSSFSNLMTMHQGSRENGGGHHLGSFLTPPVSAPSSPSPPPPHMINGSAPPQLPPLNFPLPIPRTVGSRTTNKSLTPPLAKSNPATSTVISRNEPAPVSTNNDQPTSTTLKPKFNPNAASFQPVVKSPAIVSSTPPPKRTVTPPAKTRTHPFNPLSSRFTPPICSTPSREEQAEKRASGRFNPDAPAFVPVSETPPLPARSSPPPNAPTGPACLVPRTNPPPGSSSIPPYPKLPLSPPTGPKADRNRIPPRPMLGLGIGVGVANEIQERGLPAATPLGPKAMNIPNGPRAERPLSRSYSRTYSGSEGHNSREKYTKEPAPIPTVALTRIPGIDKPVPTGPAKMLADLPAAAKIPDVPTAPAAMLKLLETGSQNGSDDGFRGRPPYLRRLSSHKYSTSIRQWHGGVNQSSMDSRNGSKPRVPKSGDASGLMGVELTVCHSEDKPVLTDEPERYDDEIAPANEAHEKAVQEHSAVAVTIEQEVVKQDDESVNVIKEVPSVEEPEAPVAVVEPSLEEYVQPEEFVEFLQPEVEETDSKNAVDTPAPVLVQQPVLTTDDIAEDTPMPVLDKIEEIVTAPGVAQPIFTTGEDTAMPVLDKIEEIVTAPTAMIVIAPLTIPIPSIQIVTDDSSRKEVDLEKDPDTNFDSFPDFRAATTPSPRLSEISMKKREEEGDEIGKNKDAIVSKGDEEAEKDQKSDEVKPVRDGSEILNVRKTKKKGKKAKKEKKNQATPDAQSVTFTTAPIDTDKPALETDMEIPAIQNSTQRGAVIIYDIDGVNTPQKNSEIGVGFTAESPLPVQPVTEAGEIDAILDLKDEKELAFEKAIPDPMEEAQPEAAKIILEENDNEKEHDGGVKLDAVDALSALPEDIEQLVKLTEIYSDSESVKDEQDEDDVDVHVPDHDHLEGEPMAEVKPLQVVKMATLAQLIEEEPVIVITPEPKAVIEEIAEIEESPVAPDEEPVAIQEPVAVVKPAVIVEEPIVVVPEPIVVVPEPIVVVPEPIVVVPEPFFAVPEPIVVVPEPIFVVPEPIVVPEPVANIPEPIAVVTEPVLTSEESPVVIELLEDLLIPAVEPSSVEEVVKEAAFFEPRHMHTGEIAVSINSIIDAIASCKDINSLSGTLETYSRVSKPGTQEERLFRELHHYAAIADPTKDNSDKRSTRSKSSMRSVRSFFKRRAEAYPQLLSSTTSRIKAILPPFLSMTAAPAINTIPTSGTITPTDHKSPIASTTTVKSQRSRLLPKMTMSLLSRSFSTRSQQNTDA